MRQSHQAAEKPFVGFPGDTIPVWDSAAGEVAVRAKLFVAVLGASSCLYAEAFPSQQLLLLGDRPRALLRGDGRLPGIVVCDNLRSAVTRSAAAGNVNRSGELLERPVPVIWVPGVPADCGLPGHARSPSCRCRQGFADGRG